MDFLSMTFSVSGVTTNVLLPPLVALVISFLTSMGGISGAFLLLPFQMSALNYTAPSVTGTNHVFNIVAIPSGVYQYIREGRMAWPLTWVVIAGTLPGVFLGYYLRVRYLPDPRIFKLFVGSVLLYIGIRLVQEMTGGDRSRSSGAKALEEKFASRADMIRKSPHSMMTAGIPSEAVLRTVSVSLRRVEYEFWGERFSFHTLGMFGLALIVGIIGGAYGIGGGAIIAPFCVAIFRLPVHTIAGATLMGTFITSLAGALFFTLLPMSQGISAMPDWPLGVLFGAGGFVGMYLGAKTQKYMPQKAVKSIVAVSLLSVAVTYIVQFF